MFQDTTAEKQNEISLARYNARFDNRLYSAATAGKSNTYANALIDEALAICGNPYYKISRRAWSAKAREFLAKFDRAEPKADKSPVDTWRAKLAAWFGMNPSEIIANHATLIEACQGIISQRTDRPPACPITGVVPYAQQCAQALFIFALQTVIAEAVK